MWDGKKRKDDPPTVARLPGVKKATSISVGETHLLIISSLYHPLHPLCVSNNPQKVMQKDKNELDELNEGFAFDDLESSEVLSTGQKEDMISHNVPSLKTLCEKAAMEHMVDPRNAIQLLEIADSLGADYLKKHCEVISFCFSQDLCYNYEFHPLLFSPFPPLPRYAVIQPEFYNWNGEVFNP